MDKLVEFLNRIWESIKILIGPWCPFCWRWTSEAVAQDSKQTCWMCRRCRKKHWTKSKI